MFYYPWYDKDNVTRHHDTLVHLLLHLFRTPVHLIIRFSEYFGFFFLFIDAYLQFELWRFDMDIFFIYKKRLNTFKRKKYAIWKLEN